MPGARMLTALLLGFTSMQLGATQATPPSSAEAATPAVAATPGDDLFAAGRFTEAAAAYERAVVADPASAAALAALARMRLYQHHEAEAVDLAHKALTIAPADPLAAQVLKTAESRRAAFGLDVYQLASGTAAASIPFVVTDPLPVVEVRIDGRPARFLLDTGAPDIALRPAFAEALRLPLSEGGVGVFAGGLHATVRRTTVPELEIGGIHVRNVPAAINPAELPGLHTDGVIGTGLLRHFLATIDYCHGRLELAPRSSSAAFEQRAAAVGANVVPMWLVGDHLIFARGAIGSVEGLFSIDTGLAGSGLVATKATLDAAGIVPDESKAAIGQGGGGAVRYSPNRAGARVGALTRSDVPGVYMADGDPYGMFRFKVAGALSHSFLRRSRVTFDFDAMKLVTEECAR